MTRACSRIAPVLLLAVGCGIFGEDTPDVTPPPDTSVPPAVGTPLEGVFVSATKGNDAYDGSDPARPIRSLALALERAHTRQSRVLACAEEYVAGALVLPDGVSIYGGYDCSTLPWTPTAARARVTSTAAVALHATGLTKPVRLDALEIVAADALATEDGATAPSSVAVVAKNVERLVLSNVLLRSGRGAPGADGVEPDASAQRETVADPRGRPGHGQGACNFGVSCADDPMRGRIAVGGAGGRSQCAVGPSGGRGGNGGDGAVFSAGTSVPAAFDTTGEGDTAETARGGANAGSGRGGAAGAQGALGASGIYGFDGDGFVPGDGKPGGVGAGGQGGGGGGGMRDWCTNAFTGGTFQFNCVPGSPSPPPAPVWHAGSGSGGGAGGCPGIPGTAGKGGGASLGLVLIDSPAVLENVRIESGVGGRGGKGTKGLAGLDGAAGAPLVTWGGAGGPGGRGGDAGASGSGASGPSIALLVKGAAPTRTNVQLAPGLGGEAPKAVTSGSQTLPGVAGRSLAEHAY